MKTNQSIRLLGKTWTDSLGVTNPGLSVFEHSTLVGASAIALLKYYPEVGHLKGLPFYISLHDVGKVSPGFQSLISMALNNGVSQFPGTEGTNRADLLDCAKYCKHHEEVTYYYLRTNKDFKKIYGKLNNTAASVLRLHHGGIRCNLGAMTSKDAGGEEWDTLRLELAQELSAVFGKVLPDFKELSKQAELVAAFTCLSDWIGSDESVFNVDPKSPTFVFSKGWELSNLVKAADKAILDRGLDRGELFKNKGIEFGAMFHSNGISFTPTSTQNLFIRAVNGPGVYVLEAPMGAGKTEAALYAAYQMVSRGLASGVYFGLPTQVTSNKIYERLEEAYQLPAKLIHANSKVWYQKKGYVSKISHWYSNNKRALLYPVGVGTVDQALLSLLSRAKHFFLRSLGLYKKVIILDEVHSYDSYTGTLIKKLIEKGHIVFVLSATLTAQAKSDMLGVPVDMVSSNYYPQVTSLARGESLSCSGLLKPLLNKRYIIKTYPLRQKDKLLEEAINKARNGCKVLWFENIVDSAQEVFREAKGQLGSSAGLLHSRFTNSDRDAIETKWINSFGKGSERKGYLLISTQVAEQSLDIDADVMYTDLCPTDMLLQRIGRVWRHDRKDRPVNKAEIFILHGNLQKNNGDEIHSFAKKYGNKTPYVYAPYTLYKTLDVIKNYSSIDIPGDMRSLLEKTYEDTSEKDFRGYWKSELIAEKNRLTSRARDNMGSAFKDAQTGTQSDEQELNACTRLITEDTDEALLVGQLVNDHEVVIGGTVYDLKDYRNGQVFSENTIKISKRKLESELRVMTCTRFDTNIVVCAKGMILDASGRPSGATYSKDLGLAYKPK